MIMVDGEARIVAVVYGACADRCPTAYRAEVRALEERSGASGGPLAIEDVKDFVTTRHSEEASATDPGLTKTIRDYFTNVDDDGMGEFTVAKFLSAVAWVC